MQLLLNSLEPQPHYKKSRSETRNLPNAHIYQVKFDSRNLSCKEVDVFLDRQKLIKTSVETNILFIGIADKFIGIAVSIDQ